MINSSAGSTVGPARGAVQCAWIAGTGWETIALAEVWVAVDHPTQPEPIPYPAQQATEPLCLVAERSYHARILSTGDRIGHREPGQPGTPARYLASAGSAARSRSASGNVASSSRTSLTQYRSRVRSLGNSRLRCQVW